MFKLKISRMVRALLMLFALGALVEVMAPSDASARVGGGRRSVGRSYSSPAAAPRQPQRPYYNSPQAPNQPNPGRSGGGFMRGLAGGLAGGFLGSMLFSSLGHASGGALGGGGGGGLGLLEIILLAGAAYFIFRWWKSRQMNLSGAGQGQSFGYSPAASPYQDKQDTYARTIEAGGSSGLAEGGAFAASLGTSALSSDEASDLFFKIQGAWTRRNLQNVKDLIGPELTTTLQSDMNELLQKGRINRLENISVRQVESLESWQEYGSEFVKMRFTANLLDYTIDEKSNQLVEGSDSEPVKFVEDWIFSRLSPQAPWQLVGIQQV